MPKRGQSSVSLVTIKAHDTHSATRFRRVFAAISRGQHPATHSAFSRRISLCDGELDCADVAGSA